MFALIIGFVSLIACGIAMTHNAERKSAGMDTYRNSEYRMMPYRA